MRRWISLFILSTLFISLGLFSLPGFAEAEHTRLLYMGQASSEERAKMSEDDRQHMTVSIRADRDTEMGLINDVKQELRKAGALQINYSATSRSQQKHN